ncbi:MAG: hypothetical protein IKS66_06885, partial [Oscillospiraceae bacterium]|nr:hypothetical protein [Oscillospiraceae bacterium]
MKKIRQIISLVLVLVMFFDYGTVAASYERASYAVSAVSELEQLILASDLEEIQGEEGDVAEAPDLAELPDVVDQAEPTESADPTDPDVQTDPDERQSDDDALLQAERVSPLSDLVNQVSRLSAPYRDDGYIHIYNYYQLSLIGTGLPVEAEDVFDGYADNREAEAPEAPDWGEEPEQPAKQEQPEQPAQQDEPEAPVELEQPEAPTELDEPEQPTEQGEPSLPAEQDEPSLPAELDEPDEPAEAEAPEAPAALEELDEPADNQPLLMQVLGRALSKVLARNAAPTTARVATLASMLHDAAEEA